MEYTYVNAGTQELTCRRCGSPWKDVCACLTLDIECSEATHAASSVVRGIELIEISTRSIDMDALFLYSESSQCSKQPFLNSDSGLSPCKRSARRRDEPQVPPPGCSLAFMLMLCAPKMAVNMAWSAQWAAFGPQLQTIFVAPWKVQLIQVIGPITGLLVSPAAGVLSDQCSSAYGRRRPFILGSLIATLLCWCIMSNSYAIGAACGDSDSNQVVTAAILLLCYLWMDVSVNVLQTSANLIIADFAGGRQVTAAAIGSVYSTLGSLCVSGYIWLFSGAQESLSGFFSMLIGVLLITCIPVLLFAKETPVATTSTTSLLRRLHHASLGVYTGVRTLPEPLAVYSSVLLLLSYGYIAYNGAKGQYFGLQVYDGDARGADSCGSNCTAAQIQYRDGVTIAGGSTDTLFNAASLVVALNVTIVVLCAIPQGAIFALQIPVIMHVIGYGEQDGLGLYAGAFNSANCLGQLLNFALSSVLLRTRLQYGLPILLGGGLSIAALLVVYHRFHVSQ
ncbi:hypothetical protein SPRG_00935 [Saprolegnia parasitica CBS 223.65]|uniref:Major facilitator superfamily (MFS) profile domain-containing protein n=1 Tax=Saprolegnia parasitica (strain CBS 223.65) TaxID=695850 RepID=A0A067D036_SAPPC|nr:hypothetical protein SPRG_00935 [Saprolegnia parasitica CBS 223.65]KDO34875.1 hypothetical protein SPRG_00935 [Saprolegnia parasitica CBS 223.65]|eukprot:XP_012194537.1 hypothetical protein SPRG_00935 [Saprolegnia parasitica CBS 223.65]